MSWTMSLFLDTNVLIDICDSNRKPHHAPAVDLYRRIVSGTFTGVMATSQMTDLYYLLRKNLGDAVARERLRGLYSACELVPTSAAACKLALDSPLADYEDAVQVETAREARCDYIVTRDAHDYRPSPVPYIDPAGLLALVDTRGGADGKASRR